MDGEGFDFFSQESAAGNLWPGNSSASNHGNGGPLRAGREDLDLNSQAADGFPYIGDYGAFLQGDGLPPQPLPRAPRSLGVPNQRVGGGGSGWGVRAPQSACHLNFGGSSLSAAGRGGPTGAAPTPSPRRPRANTAATAPVSAPTRRRTSRSNSSQRGGGGQRVRASRPPAPRNGGINIGGSGQSIHEDDKLSDGVEEFGSSGGHPDMMDEGNGAMMDEADDDLMEEEDDGSTMSSEDEIVSMCCKNLKEAQNVIAQMAPILGMYSDHYFWKLPYRTEGEKGIEWVMRTLGRDISCYNMFRVERALFNRLHNTLVLSYGLQDSSKMSSIDALAMFLWIVGAPQSIRQAEDRFRRSMETISRSFNKVLTCVLRLSKDIIVPKDPTFSEVHPHLENPSFWPHFNDCIGAIDGTHIKMVVPNSTKIPHLNRHNETSQNVMAVCDFDMRFTFVLAGWPGSAHDMRVFKDAMTTHHHKFPHPPQGKYYVVDAGYPNRPGYLSPYRCTRYHVEQWQNGPPPQGIKETFNHAHAQVRNVIERSFGVLKMKFRILLNMPRFPERKRTRIIVACMALHNFIRESRIGDRDFQRCDADANYDPMPNHADPSWPNDEPLVEDSNMNVFRDELASALFY